MKIKLRSMCRVIVLTAAFVSTPYTQGGIFIHPGALHTQKDFDRMREKVLSSQQPWIKGWNMLIKNPHGSLNWSPHPQPTVYRGFNGTNKENYSLLYNDAAAAYALALRWKITNDNKYADQAVIILNAWSNTLKQIDGTSDKFLAAGIYGYQLANAAEILRTYSNWKVDDFRKFKNFMLYVFYHMNHDFLMNHNGAKVDHYWANWDLANMASMIAIGILTDRRDIYQEAVNYFKYGKGNGALNQLVWKIYSDNLGQTQESGRDQGHNTLNAALVGAFCQMAWNQGEDLFGYQNSRVLSGMEYIAKYNLGYDVPYTPYKNSDVLQNSISPVGRGNSRPVWELLYNHYVVIKRKNAPYISEFARKIRPEGGGGDYGPNSGGFDQLGYGTLTYSLR